MWHECMLDQDVGFKFEFACPLLQEIWRARNTRGLVLPFCISTVYLPPPQLMILANWLQQHKGHLSQCFSLMSQTVKHQVFYWHKEGSASLFSCLRDHFTAYQSKRTNHPSHSSRTIASRLSWQNINMRNETPTAHLFQLHHAVHNMMKNH